MYLGPKGARDDFQKSWPTILMIGNICDRAQQNGVKCLKSVSEKWSSKHEMFQERDVQEKKIIWLRNVTFEK